MKKKADVDIIESETNDDANEDKSIMQSTASPENSCDNEFAITLSRSLAKQLHNLSKYEGIHSIDLLLELVTEGIARRIMEDQTRPAPSHLMTRNGYVDQQNTQPSMSHHAFQSNGNMRDGQNNNRGKNNFQRHTPSTLRPQNNARYNNNRGAQNNLYTNGNSGSYFKPPKKSEF